MFDDAPPHSSPKLPAAQWGGGLHSWGTPDHTSLPFPWIVCLSCSHSQRGVSTSETTVMAKEQRPSIVYGPRAPVPLTLTFGQLLDHHAEVRPDSPAVISHVQNRTISYRQLCDRSINLAKAMADAGVGKGTLVGIISGSRIEYLEVGYRIPAWIIHC